MQVSCSDVRERFHLFALLFVVVVQTMKEYGWREESFWTLVWLQQTSRRPQTTDWLVTGPLQAPDCLLVLGAEILVDWLKHAFITRCSGLPGPHGPPQV
jgi:hypothetical protein